MPDSRCENVTTEMYKHPALIFHKVRPILGFRGFRAIFGEWDRVRINVRIICSTIRLVRETIKNCLFRSFDQLRKVIRIFLVRRLKRYAKLLEFSSKTFFKLNPFACPSKTF